MRRRLGRVARLLKIPAIIFCCVIVLAVGVALGRAAVECRPFSSGPAPATHETSSTELAEYARSEDQTYLTLPEWYIVYSAEEYAAFVADRPPSGFPYFSAIGQFWQSYYDVCAVTRERYAFNGGYHLLLGVIGTSFTVENIVKGIYENTVGRVTELVSSDALTDEDAYARQVAAEYGAFLHMTPWYEFPFTDKLSGLWRETSFWGPNIVRKAERKAALSVEYGSKAIYAWLIKLGTQSVYDAADLEIGARVTGLPPDIAQQEPQVRVISQDDSRTAMIILPRYESFSEIVPRLAREGVQFTTIAGNDVILLTVIAPHGWQYNLDGGDAIFAMPILTQPDRQRIAVSVPVASLHRVLLSLDGQPVILEHIYDY